jgi:hypothetical protein
MAKRKIVLFLTDCAFHTSEKRPTTQFNKAVKYQTPEGLPYGRLYSSMGVDGKMRIQIPADMQAAIDRGEIEVQLAFPKKGLPVYAGKDTQEKIKQMKKKERNELIHHGRTWHAPDTGIQ